MSYNSLNIELSRLRVEPVRAYKKYQFKAGKKSETIKQHAMVDHLPVVKNKQVN